MSMELDIESLKHGKELVKRGFARMQKGGVIMDVVNAEQADIGTNKRTNKVLKKIRDESYAQLDITKKRIELSLDSEIGAVCHSFFNSRKA